MDKKNEFLLGVSIGLLLAILLSVKAMAAEITLEDEELIAKVVSCEAENQSLQGKRYVVSVILNRVDDPAFPNTVSEVISQKGQFSTYDNLETVTPSWKSELATKMEIEGRSDYDITFFRAGHFGCGKPAFQYEDHYFSTSE